VGDEVDFGDVDVEDGVVESDAPFVDETLHPIKKVSVSYF